MEILYKIKNIFLEKDLDLLYRIMDKLIDIINNIVLFIENFKCYLPILRTDRWWDYSYFENLLLHKLKQMEKHWGVDTHHQGDCFTKKRLQVLIKKFENLNEMENKIYDYDKVQKEREKVYKLLAKNIHRFWD
jgi:hypothetical protein